MSNDIKLYWMFLLVGCIPVIVAASRSGDWGVQATVGAAMSVWAIVSLARIAFWRRHARTRRCR